MLSPAAYYDRVKNFLLDELWRTDIENLNPLTAWLYSCARMLFVLVREFSSGQLNLRAMSLVYTTLLSLVPLLAVSFSVLKAFGVHNQIEPLLLNLVTPLGEKGNELVMQLLGFVENMKVGVLGSLGLALLLYTVVSLIQKVENAFNYVWHAESSRSFSRRFSDYLSVIMIGPVLVFSAIGLTASLMSSDIVQQIISIEPFGFLLVMTTKLLPYLLIILAFCFVYLFIPNTKVKFKSALLGAVVGGALWQACGVVFAEFAASSTKYDAIYSSFAILILFMIWLYLSWLILLIGTQVAYYYQYPDQVRLSSQRLPLQGRFREQIGLLALYWIAYRFIHEDAPATREALAELLHTPSDRIGEILQMLEGRDLIVESSSEPTEYLLRYDPASQTVAEIVEAIRSPSKVNKLMEERMHSVPAIEELMVHIDNGIRHELGELTLRQLVLSNTQGVSSVSGTP